MPANPVKKNLINTVPEIGALIRRMRKEQRLTQAEVAGLCNVGARFFSELENGKPGLRLDLVLRVIQTMGLNCVLERR